MDKYILKSALIAEIEKRLQELRPTDTHKMQTGEKVDRDVLMWLNALTWVKKIVDSLETKEIRKPEEEVNASEPETDYTSIIARARALMAKNI